MLSAAVLAIPAAAARAEEAAAGGAGTVDYHGAPASDIVVTAPLHRDRQDLLSGVAILSGRDLDQAIRPTIGETLARTPGVSATSFGPNASRPVLRGLQGERVRVLTDGIGSIDVSNTSVDHAVAINPLLAERIEVLRGPASLLFGSAAIGGVVNVIDRRIPRSLPDEGVHIDALAGYGSAADERSGGASVDVPVAGRLVLHADGSYLKTGDLRIGGRVLSRAARDEALANAGTEDDDQRADGIDFAANAGLRNRLPNSAAKTWTAGAGASIVTDTGHFGISYGRYDSLYGVPVRYATGPGQEQEGPRLDLKQDRWDGRAEVQTGGGVFQMVRARVGYAKYRHFELEENGEVGTAFYNKGMEGRVELIQSDRGAWKGVVGGQYMSRDFNVVGEEAFLPKNRTEQVGLFTLQQLDYGALKLEAGGRYEHTDATSAPVAGSDFFDGVRRFSTFSFSGGASYGFGDGWRLGGNVSRTERAPSAEELFANGPHAGTEAFEIGDPTYDKEKSWGVEAVLRRAGADWRMEASAYYNWFDGYIYDERTGELRDGLPVYQGRQGDARYYGFEVQGSATVARFGATAVVVDALADYVRAKIRDVGPAPRIPPLRLLGGVGVNSAKIDGRVEVEWNDRQDRVSTFETATPGFTLVNAQLTVRPWGTERPLSLIFSANNIFDVTARRHASFLKDFAPLSGRDLRVAARLSF